MPYLTIISFSKLLALNCAHQIYVSSSKGRNISFPIAESAFYVSINRISTKNDVQVFKRSWYHLCDSTRAKLRVLQLRIHVITTDFLSNKFQTACLMP